MSKEKDDYKIEDVLNDFFDEEDDDEDDLTFDDEIETEWEKRGCTFSEYRNFVSGK